MTKSEERRTATVIYNGNSFDVDCDLAYTAYVSKEGSGSFRIEVKVDGRINSIPLFTASAPTEKKAKAAAAELEAKIEDAQNQI